MAAPRFETIRFSDGYEAALRTWLPVGPRGCVLYLHGIQSHGGWYEGCGGFLEERGFAVLMPDRRGSGRNAQARGHAPSAARLIDDGRELLGEAARRSGVGAVHVVGVSWGGKWAVALAVAAPRAVASLSLVAPGLFPRVDLPLGEKFRIAWSLLAEPDRPFPLPLNEPELFTRNPARLAELRQDPLRLLAVSASFLRASRALDGSVRGFPSCGWAGPVHLVLAGEDRIIDNDRTRAYFRGLPHARRQLTEYPQAYHTIEFEPDPRPYWTALADWLEGPARGAEGSG